MDDYLISTEDNIIMQEINITKMTKSLDVFISYDTFVNTSVAEGEVGTRTAEIEKDNKAKENPPNFNKIEVMVLP